MAGDNLEVTNWRVRTDTLDPNTDGDWLGGPRINPPPIPIGQRFRIRYVLLRNPTTGGPVSRNIRHEHNRESAGWFWTRTASNPLVLALSTFYAHKDESTENFLSGRSIMSNTGLMEGGGTDVTGAMSFADSGAATVEVEVCLMFPIGGTSLPGQKVKMRLRRSNGNAFGDGHVTVPEITVAAELSPGEATLDRVTLEPVATLEGLDLDPVADLETPAIDPVATIDDIEIQ